MSASAKCPSCSKTVYPEEMVQVAGGKWHSWCCKCPGECGKACGISLDHRTAMAHEGSIYCKKHVPKPKATAVADDIMVAHAVRAQSVKSHAKEDAGVVGAIHQDMRANDNKVIAASTPAVTVY